MQPQGAGTGIHLILRPNSWKALSACPVLGRIVVRSFGLRKVVRDNRAVSAEQINTGVAVGWVCIDCTDPQRLAGWWQQLLGGTVSVDDDGDVCLDTDTIPILFLGVSESKTVKNRVHLDLRVTDFDGAVTKAKALGATPADDVYVGDRWQVFRDPDGNEFCIIRPSAAAENGA
jgi:hypothetical protein